MKQVEPMMRTRAAALLMLVLAPFASADDVPGMGALNDAMSGLFVVIPTDPSNGASMMEVVKGTDGTEQQVVVAFLDAGDAARTAEKAGLADRAEGRLVNAAELIAMAKGKIIWRTNAENAILVNGDETRPPLFYVTGAGDDPLIQPVEGKTRIVFYTDAMAADAARVAAQNSLSAAGEPEELSVIAADMISILEGIGSGKVKDAYIASSPTVIIWAAQWDQGKRLIRDYSPN
ncbi:MAG: hypothetical protein WEA77_10585 [Hyphomonas sp.]|uniref:hypothetical protein n=1 Tax=Hyphomonas sp. TaxID=87 RepID=UPI0034A01463